VHIETDLVVDRMAISDAISFDGTHCSHMRLSSVSLEKSSYEGVDPLNIQGFNEIAKIIVSVGRFAVVRMHKGLTNKLSNVCKPVLIDIEQKLDFLDKLRFNLASFGNWLEREQTQMAEAMKAATTEAQQREILRHFIMRLLREMNGVTQAINDVAHARDMSAYERNREKLEGLPQGEYRMVETFYYNYRIFTSSFARNAGLYNHALSQDVPELALAIESLMNIAQSATSMIKATGDIFGKK